MSEAFLKIVNMSISASWLVLVVFALRLLLKKAPKWVNVLLWGLVAVRLLCPFSIESAMSLIPSAEVFSPTVLIETPEIHTGIPAINNAVNPVIQDSFITLAPEKSVNTMKFLIQLFSRVWAVGVALLLAYSAVSVWRLRRRMRTAVILRDNIFLTEFADSPFVLGIVRPRIYLPYGMDDTSMTHVIAHEQAHIRRKDHWWKPLGFGLLTIHWFNPLMWLAYILLCRDIELACDEKVISELGNEQRADYSHALVACSVSRLRVAACPLAFGEVGVKERVKNVMNYRKPAFWVIASALIVCALAAVCFLTSPERATFDEIHEENGYRVIDQDEVPVTLCVDKAKLPDSIYTAEGYQFDKNEVVAYSTETSQIYLYKAMISNESDDLLYFTFDISYDLPNSGSFISLYKDIDDSDALQYNLHLQSEDLRDVNTSHPDSVDIRAFGPGNQFAFYVSREACQAANGMLMIDIVCNQIDYTSEPRTILGVRLPEIRNGYIPVEPDVDAPFGCRYSVSEIAYADLRYSFSYTTKTAPKYDLTPDHQLFVAGDALHASNPTDWEQHPGYFQEIALTKKNFDDYFIEPSSISGWSGDWTGAELLRSQTKQAWRLDVEGSANGDFYYLILTKSGDVLLCYGYDTGESQAGIVDQTLIRWVFVLEPETSEPDSEAPVYEPKGVSGGNVKELSRVPDDVQWQSGIGFSELAPGEEVLSDHEIVIEEDGTDMLLTISWARASLCLEYGIRREDGTAFFQEKRGGYGHLEIEDIPAGTYHLYVRNSDAYAGIPAYENPAAFEDVSFDATGVILYALK